jgi:hypothetical protein
MIYFANIFPLSIKVNHTGSVAQIYIYIYRVPPEVLFASRKIYTSGNKAKDTEPLATRVARRQPVNNETLTGQQ